MKCVWLSRHKPLGKQKRDLKKLGYDEIVQYGQRWMSAVEISELLKKEKADAAVIVAPLSMIAQLLLVTKCPLLWAEMEVLHDKCEEGCKFKKSTDTIACGRHYRFKGFKRIKKVEMILEDV